MEELRLLSRAVVTQITAATILESARVHQEHQIAYWDALIVVAASTSRCAALYTEDLNAGLTIEGVLIINPFAKS